MLGGALVIAPFFLLDAYPYVFPTGIAISAIWIGLLENRHVEPRHVERRDVERRDVERRDVAKVER